MDDDRNDREMTTPFFSRRSGGIEGFEGFEIIDSNGTVAIWAYGEEAATTVVAALNEFLDK